MTPWKHLPILLSALLCLASCDLGSSPGGGGTEGEGLSGRLQDPSGRPITGVLVRVFPENPHAMGKTSAAAEAIFDSIYSDKRGFFKFKKLPSGNYGLRTYTRRGDTTLVLLLRRIAYAGKEKSLGTQTLVVGGRLTMKVRPGTTSQGGHHPELAGTRCEVVDLPIVSVTDETGRCEIDALPPGQYAVRLSHPGFPDVVTNPIEVRPGQSSGEGPWELPPSTNGHRYPNTPRTIAHWTFDARDSLTGDFPDAISRAVSLQGFGSVPLNLSPYGKAASFNGSSYLRTVDIQPGLGARNGRYLTLEARVRLTQYPSPSNKDSAAALMGAAGAYSLAVRSNGSIALLKTLESNAEWPSQAAWSGPGVVPLNQWVDLALSLDKQTLQAYAFVNGAPVMMVSPNAYIPNAPDPKSAFHVGGYPGTSRFFVGEIDEARVSDTLVFGPGLPMARMDTTRFYPAAQTVAVADAGLSSLVPDGTNGNHLTDWNSGADVSFTVGTYDMASSYRAVARFAIPAGMGPENISRAVIRMHVHSWVEKNVSGVIRLDAHRLLRSWKEGTGRGTGYMNSAQVDGVTARDRFWTGNASATWNQIFIGLDGVDAAAAPAASAFIQSRSGTVLEWDVTELARAWAADTSKNFGVVFASPFPASNAQVMDFPRLHTRESPVDSLRPMLILNGPAPAPRYTEVAVAADADVTISSSAPGNPDVQGYGSKNRGKETSFGPATYDMSASSRALLRFPVPAGYPAARIVSARIRLTPTGWTLKNAKRPYTIDVHRMLKSWKEGNGTGTANSAAIDGATGLERFWGTQNGSEDWGRALVALNDSDAASIPSATQTKPTGSLENWEFDVTALAKAWAADTTRNFGVLLSTAIPTSNAAVWDYPLFHSRETATPALRPTLVLTVSP